jgi:hypothetical protein
MDRYLSVDIGKTKLNEIVMIHEIIICDITTDEHLATVVCETKELALINARQIQKLLVCLGANVQSTF